MYKRQYIHNKHYDTESDAILFVDDRAENLRAVCDAPPWKPGTPLPHGIEILKYKFQTKEGDTYAHATTLKEALQLILEWSRISSSESTPTQATETNRDRKRHAEMEAPKEKATKKSRSDSPVRHAYDIQRTICMNRLGLTKAERPDPKQAFNAFIELSLIHISEPTRP